MSDASANLELAVARCQAVMAHAWMVRTFVKHSAEVEEFPELMGIVRTVFDMARALETQIDNPAGYFKMLQKKLGKLRQAAEAFRTDAPRASDHTNFKQAVISIDTCVGQLEELLRENAPRLGRSGSPPASAAGRESQAESWIISLDEDQTE
jgi:hypothetical protein